MNSVRIENLWRFSKLCPIVSKLCPSQTFTNFIQFSPSSAPRLSHQLFNITNNQIRDVSPQKKRENVGIFSKSRPPRLSPVWEFFPDFTVYFWGVSHVKKSKKWMWDSGRPTPLFFPIPTFSRFFLQTSLISPLSLLLVCYLSVKSVISLLSLLLVC